MKTTVIFLLNKSKQNKRTKKIPIYLRVIHNFSKAEARLNAEINPEEEFLWNPVSMRFSDRDSLINQQLNNVETELRKFIILNETKLSEFSAKDIRDLVMGVKRGRKNISIADFKVLLTINGQKMDIVTEQYLVGQAIDICKRSSILPEVRVSNSLLAKRSTRG